MLFIARTGSVIPSDPLEVFVHFIIRDSDEEGDIFFRNEDIPLVAERNFETVGTAHGLRLIHQKTGDEKLLDISIAP